MKGNHAKRPDKNPLYKQWTTSEKLMEWEAWAKTQEKELKKMLTARQKCACDVCDFQEEIIEEILGEI